MVDAGSVRARGCGGTFSEFVLVRDQAQNYTSELIAAFAGLASVIDDAAVGPTARATLGTDHHVSRSAFEAGNFSAAIAGLDDLTEHSGILGGPALPNRCSSAMPATARCCRATGWRAGFATLWRWTARSPCASSARRRGWAPRSATHQGSRPDRVKVRLR